MKNFILLCTISLLFSINSIQAQYQSAIGVRIGYPLSVSYKQFISEKNALELIVGTRGFTSYRWVSISGAFQIHEPLDLGIEGLENLRVYYGAGASIFLWSSPTIDFKSRTSFGLQVYGGLDYQVPETNLNVTIDWSPTFRLNGYLSGFGAGYGSLGVRYILSGNDED